jgi:hypothetical protein
VKESCEVWQIPCRLQNIPCRSIWLPGHRAQGICSKPLRQLYKIACETSVAGRFRKIFPAKLPAGREPRLSRSEIVSDAPRMGRARLKEWRWHLKSAVADFDTKSVEVGQSRLPRVLRRAAFVVSRALQSARRQEHAPAAPAAQLHLRFESRCGESRAGPPRHERSLSPEVRPSTRPQAPPVIFRNASSTVETLAAATSFSGVESASTFPLCMTMTRSAPTTSSTR